jgi:hypothetical protein
LYLKVTAFSSNAISLLWGDGDAMDIARQISEHRLGSAERDFE